MTQRLLFSPFQQARIRIELLIAVVITQGVIILGWIFSTPSDPDVRRFLGYSAQRWVIIAAAGMITTLFALALIRVHQNTIVLKDGRIFSQPWLFSTVSAAGLLLLALDDFALQYIDGNLSAILPRILPMAVLLLLVSLEMIVLPWAAIPPHPGWQNLVKAARIWAFFLGFALVILLTHFGLESVSNGWYEYGVPLMHEQVANLLLGTAVAALLLTGIARWKTRLHLPPLTMDMLLAGLIWGAAVLTWLPMPVPQTWMSPKPLAPNFEVYPYSDAALYDSAAQGILLGTAWAHDTVHNKPLYVGFLTLAHAALGFDYKSGIRLQGLLLALFPVMVYLVGRTMHSRLAGILAAAAVIIREYNQLAVSSLITTSNSKLMLSELPLALGCAALLFMLALWLKKPKRLSILPILVGGMIGFLVQIRLQAILFLPALVVLLFIYYRTRYFKRWLVACGLMILGFSISLAPLLYHNWVVSGQITIEQPGYFERTLNYSFTPSGSNPASPVQAEPGLGGNQSPATWVYLIGSHFVHNLVHTLLVLPTGYGANSSWTRAGDLSSTFWVQYLAPLTPSSALWMAFNLALVALGIQIAWQKNRRLALLPLLILLVYDFSSALGGFSGQRFLLPVDWICYFYFFIGAAWLCASTLSHMGVAVHPAIISKEQSAAGSFHRPARQYSMLLGGAAGLVLAAGLIYPVAQVIVPIKYNSTDTAKATLALTSLAQAALSPVEQAQLKEMLSYPNVQILHGAALYPRLMTNINDSVGVTLPDDEVNYPYLSYTFAGDRRVTVLQPITNQDSLVFPHAAEVIVAGWTYQGRFHAFATALPSRNILYFSPNLGK